MCNENVELTYQGKKYTSQIDLSLDDLTVFIEFKLKPKSKLSYDRRRQSEDPQLVFQLYLNSIYSKRVITHSVNIRQNDTAFIVNESIIHANSQKRIRELFWQERRENGQFVQVKSYAQNYEEFMRKFQMKNDKSKKTIQLLSKSKLDDEDAAFMSNNTAFDVDQVFVEAEVNVPKQPKPEWKSPVISAFPETRKLLTDRDRARRGDMAFKHANVDNNKSIQTNLRRLSSSMSERENYSPETFIQSLLNENPKLIIQTSLDLPPINAPVTRFFKKQNNRVIELSKSDTAVKENLDFRLFSNELKKPIGLVNDIKIKKEHILLNKNR